MEYTRYVQNPDGSWSLKNQIELDDAPKTKAEEMLNKEFDWRWWWVGKKQLQVRWGNEPTFNKIKEESGALWGEIVDAFDRISAERYNKLIKQI